MIIQDLDSNSILEGGSKTIYISEQQTLMARIILRLAPNECIPVKIVNLSSMPHDDDHTMSISRNMQMIQCRMEQHCHMQQLEYG